MKMDRAQNAIKVWFYTDASLASEIRTAPFAPRYQIDDLVQAICSCMELNERFACFKTEEGQIVALSRNGEFVMV